MIDKNGQLGTTAPTTALLDENLGNGNTAAEGVQALANTSNQPNGENTATGWQSLFANTTGRYNTANGFQALKGNIDGGKNTATGWNSLLGNVHGVDNTATGNIALQKNIGGNSNTAMGYEALAKSTGNFNIGLGQGAGSKITIGDNNIDIGNQGVAGEEKTIRIGDGNHKRVFVAGIFQTPVTNAPQQVFVDSNGQLGAPASSERFKKDIKAMEDSSDALLALMPVTFRYKSDGTDTPQYGLIAEQVERINPDLVVRDAEGKVFSIRYDAVNAMLLNEFLKQHRKVETLEATASRQQQQIAALTATLKEQSAQIRKVSAQIEMKPAPQRVAKNR